MFYLVQSEWKLISQAKTLSSPIVFLHHSLVKGYEDDKFSFACIS